MDSTDPTRWSPELRRALISVQPDFFGWPPDEQLRYRVKLPHTDRQALVAALLRIHGRRRPLATAKLESNGRVSPALQNEINQWLQPLIGIGEDAFSLNEHFAEGRSILDFPTLLAYDEDDHAFQEDARQREDPQHVRRPYAGRLHATWARCLIDGRLAYLTLSMAAARILDRMETAANEAIERLVPHRYVAGPHDGKVEDGLIRWDQRVDAGGDEALLEALQHLVWDFEAQRFHELAAEFRARGQAATWFIDDPYPDDPQAGDETSLLIVFSDPEALARVRFTSFLRDCRAIERPREELLTVDDREVRAILDFVHERHDDLRRNVDPRVRTLRPRRKVLLHPAALRDIDS